MSVTLLLIVAWLHAMTMWFDAVRCSISAQQYIRSCQHRVLDAESIPRAVVTCSQAFMLRFQSHRPLVSCGVVSIVTSEFHTA
jgi:hypothetical protein